MYQLLSVPAKSQLILWYFNDMSQFRGIGAVSSLTVSYDIPCFKSDSEVENKNKNLVLSISNDIY